MRFGLDRGASRGANRALYRIVIVRITPTNLSRLGRGLEQNTKSPQLALDRLAKLTDLAAA